MKKTVGTILAVILVLAAGTAVYFIWQGRNTPSNQDVGISPIAELPTVVSSAPAADATPAAIPESAPELLPPLDRASERVTKKPFGIHIIPATSPVQPEKFQGYHTGTDFEIFPDELNGAVSVKAICVGTITHKERVGGYGGVLVQNCRLKGAPITVIYGHLSLASITKNTGDDLTQGEVIGNLGKGYSAETDGERKHLHLGIHKGSGINIRGYVSMSGLLSGWVDPCFFVCPNQ